MNFDPSLLDDDPTPRHELLIDINESSQSLIQALKIQREPDIELKTLRFDIDTRALESVGFIYRNVAPGSILTDLLVDSEINRLTNKASLCVWANLRNPDGVADLTIQVRTSDGENGEPITTLVVEDSLLPSFDPATTIELNRFLASLFITNKTGDYSAFDAMNASQVATNERLIDAISEVAEQSHTNGTYFLGPTVGLNANSIEFSDLDGTLTDMAVTMEHHGKSSCVKLDLSPSKERKLNADELEESNPEFMMQKIEGLQSYILDRDGISEPVTSSTDQLRTFKDFLASQISQVFTHTEIVEISEEDVDESLQVNIEDLR